MAIYHYSVKVIRRSSGRSATGAAAYRSGTCVIDERTEMIHDYTQKQRIDEGEILAPDQAPAWVFDRGKLWNQVELSEKRKDAQVCREVVVALPRELAFDQMKSLVHGYVRDEFVSLGMVADINLHDLDSSNPHAHILLTMRELGEVGFGKKNRTWNQKALLQQWRVGWEDSVNKVLEKYGHEVRIDHRSLVAQGIERIPQIHLGPHVVEMEKRGIETIRGARGVEIKQYNQFLEQKYDVIADESTKKTPVNASNAVPLSNLDDVVERFENLVKERSIALKHDCEVSLESFKENYQNVKSCLDDHLALEPQAPVQTKGLASLFKGKAYQAACEVYQVDHHVWVLEAKRLNQEARDLHYQILLTEQSLPGCGSRAFLAVRLEYPDLYERFEVIKQAEHEEQQKALAVQHREEYLRKSAENPYIDQERQAKLLKQLEEREEKERNYELELGL